MAISIGDKVRFLNDVGSGVVVRIVKNIVYVSDEDGFERPTPETQVVVIESFDKQQKKAIKAEVISQNDHLKSTTKHIIKPVENDNTLYLAIYPVKFPFAETDLADIYLLNDTNFVALYNLCSISDKMATTIKAGFLEPNTREHIFQCKINKLDKLISYKAIQYQSVGKYTIPPTLEGEIHLKSLDIVQSKTFKLNPFFDHQALLYKLQTANIPIDKELLYKLNEKFIGDKENLIPNRKVKTDINDILEIDLHIEQLRDDLRHLIPTEILPIQLEYFHKIMGDNLVNKGKRIVFIHGVGNGKLKGEVLKLLSKNYPKCEVQDASFQEYGFGATRVTIR